MARMMTEDELLAFYEFNRRLSLAQEATGKSAEAKHLVGIAHEIEKHLYRFTEHADAERGEAGHGTYD